MKYELKRLCCALALFLIVAVSAFGQESSSITGGLSGVVTDATGAALPGATVTLVGPQGTHTLTTDNLGRYAASGLTPGFYDVTVNKPGFKKLQAKHSEVVVNSSSSLNLAMTVGDVAETVEVTSTAVDIDTQSTAITTNLTDTFYNSIPMPRNVSAIFYVAPGVAPGQVAGSANQAGPGANNPSIGGASGLENLYVVDGVTITDQAFGSIGTYNRFKGSLGTGINLAFIKEVDIKTTAFEPQYGKATGGIVQIVTKSGSNKYHGALGAYMGPGAFYASRYQYYQFGYVQVNPSQTLSSPQYDVSAELGGYVPGFRDKLFFFGAFDPALVQNINFANPKSTVTFAHGQYPYSTTTLSWAGKLTYKLGDATTFEASSFGDPAKHNVVPNTLATNIPLSVSSSYQYGSRDSVARATSAITPTWLVDASYAYNHNSFRETPAINQYGITDTSRSALIAPLGNVSSGFGGFEPSTNNTYSIAANTSKTAHFLGQHTFSVGYAYDHTNFLDQPSRSGALFAMPSANMAGTSLVSLFPNIPASSIGAFTNASFTVAATNTNSALTTTDTTCDKCPTNATGQRVYASVSRGTYVGLNVKAAGRYHTAYGNDVYQMNRFVTINAGVRWEEERVGGSLLSYAFTGSWSPRVGINLDPMGDHKSKLFFNYGRNYWAMPLDAAIRQLGNEKDDTSFVFWPVINSDGSYTIIPDDKHNLNGLPRSTNASGTVSKFGGPNFASSTGEGIIPGTKGEYEDEYVLGFERQITNNIVVKARWTDRRLGRIIEDITAVSPEGSEVALHAYEAGGISNPGPTTDIGVNEKEVTYTQAQFLAANPPGSTTYNPPVAGCTAANDSYSTVGGPFIDGRNQPVGGACILNYQTADAAGADGVPDGFVKPVRRYQALELEFDKRFSNHWLAQVNYRWGTLYGNYEGAYRNDNGQSDPGISSLFDFTAGQLNLLGNQFSNGDLSSDRRNVGNLFLSYNIGSDTRFFHAAKGLTLGTGLRGQSGVPLSLLGDHPIYLNQGEVPIGGRGAAGRTPATMQLDLKAEYPRTFRDKYTLKLALDAFNVTNSQFQTGRVQYTQTSAAAVGAPPPLNKDYGRPTSFQGPFYARASVRFEF
jgi:hypothetical protein